MNHSLKQSLVYKNMYSDVLKIIAMICMVIDHSAVALMKLALDAPMWAGMPFEKLEFIFHLARQIGRVSFPIFCFFIVEGFFKTKNRVRYLERLLLFAMLSEIPFDLALRGTLTLQKQNTMFTLAIGLATIWGMQKVERKYMATGWEGMSQLMILLLGCGSAWICRTDYSYQGIALIAIFYLFREKRWCACLLGYLCMISEPFSITAFLLLLFYNGKRWKAGKSWQYAFYLFYPLHLTVLYVVRMLLLY